MRLRTGVLRIAALVIASAPVVAGAQRALPGPVPAARDQARSVEAPAMRPAVFRVAPNRLEAGNSYTLAISGSGFVSGMAANFVPAGLRVLGPVLVQSAGMAQLRVQVAPEAAAGFRTLALTVPAPAAGAAIAAMPGKPATIELLRAVEVVAQATTSPTMGPPPLAGPGALPPMPGIRPPPGDTGIAPPGPSLRQPATIAARVIRMVPSSGEPGSTYTLELQGSALSPALRVSFGTDIEIIGPLQVLGTGKARVDIRVRPTAFPGPRRLQLASGPSAAFVDQGLQFSINARRKAAQASRTMPVPQIPLLDVVAIVKQRIDLTAPDWKTQTASTVPPKDPVTGKPLGAPQPVWSIDVPQLREDQLFSWKELNPGTAEWFEVRFYRKDQQVATRRIDPQTIKVGKATGSLLPTWLRADAQLIMQLVPPGTATGTSRQAKLNLAPGETLVAKPPGGKPGQSAPTAEQQAAAMADLYWEVAGFRSFQANGVAKSAGTGPDADMVVEPILLAAAGPPPPVSGKPGKAPAADSLADTIATTVEVEISDRWPLATPFRPTGLACGQDITGKFSLVNLSKQGLGSNRTWDVMRLTGEFSLAGSPYLSKPQTSKPSFMGKVIVTSWAFDNLFIDWGDGTQEPFKTFSGGDAGDYHSDVTLSLGDKGWTHQYQEPGNYVVRVYQLANGAVQKGGTEVLTASVGEQAGVYHQALAMDGNQALASEQLAVGKAAADSAYMLYCQHVSVSPRTDPDATGPLKLVSIDIQGFPWAESKASRAGKPLPKQASSAGQGGAVAAAKSSPSVQATATEMNMAAAAPKLFGTGAGGAPTFTACDVSLTAGAALTYVGQGSARLRWRLDGAVFHEEVYDDIGPSPPRPDKMLAQDPAKWAAVPKGVRANLLSGPVPLDKPASHKVAVEAEVIYSTRTPALYAAISQALGAGGQLPDAAAAKAILLGSQGGPKIGVLTPYTQTGGGLPAVSYVREALEQVARIDSPPTLAANAGALPPVLPLDKALNKSAGSLVPKKTPPEFVESGEKPYQVVGHDSALPCTFEFPVSGGSFRVGGLQSGGKANVSHQGNVFSGSGVLQLPVPGQPGKHLPLPLAFKNWTIAADGFTVTQGKLDAGKLPGGELTAAGLAYSVEQLTGTAQVSLEASLKSRFAQGSIQAMGNGSPPEWPVTSAVLSPQGDWYATGPSPGELGLYDSGFTLAPKAVALDLSAAEGAAPDASCAAGGNGWIGVHLGVGATLRAFDFDLPGDSTAAVDHFGIDSSGLCGTAQMGAFSAKQLRGEFRWDGIKVTAGNGQFNAVYQNLRVKVPWLDAELHGAQDPLLKAGEGVGKQSLSLNLTGGPVTRQQGPVTLMAQDLQLVKMEDMVPAVRSDTRFTFAGENKVFAKDVWVKGLYFGLDGRAYLPPGVTEVKTGLAGQSGAIGQAALALDDVTVRVPASGNERLVFDFNGKVTISKALEPAAMTVRYTILEPGENMYTAAGPVAGTVEPLSVTFPKAEGTVKGKIKAIYVGTPGPTAATPPPLFGWIPAALADSSQIRFKGTVDMSMFALPVTADFALGYAGGDDFWAIKAIYDGFGPNGAPLVPPFLNMFAIGGGLGYNVSLESLKGQGLESLGYASSGGVPVFNAASLVGTPDGLTLGLRGDLSIKVAGSEPGTRIDFGAYLLSPSQNWKSGSPLLEGFVKYQGGAFDGELWGAVDFLGGAAGINAPKGAAQLHFGNGDWYAYFGRDTGPRIEGHALFIKRNAYLMLSPAKMAMGGGADINESLGDCGDVCAYVAGSADVGLALSTSPVKLAGTSTVSVDAGGCYEDSCAGVGGDVAAYGELPGPVVRYGFSIDLPCPVPDVGVTLKVLPSPGISPDLDWCDLNPLW